MLAQPINDLLNLGKRYIFFPLHQILDPFPYFLEFHHLSLDFTIEPSSLRC